MDDGFTFVCGSVPILLLLWHGPGPAPWWRFVLLAAGCLGGLAANRAFGPIASGGGAVSLFLVAVAGGSLAGLAVDAIGGLLRGGAATKSVN
jgi:hypothetical protein